MYNTVAKIVIKDEVNIRIKGLDPSTMKEVQDRITFFVPGYIHMPSYKLGRWDGMIRLITKTGSTCLNLLEYLIPIIVSHGYDIEIEEDNRKDYSDVTNSLSSIDENYLSDIIFKGEPLKIRDYQLEGVNTALEYGSGILEMATGSGKTLVCAIMSLIYSEIGKVVVIVPNIDLVIQTQHTFKQVGIDAGIWYGEVKEHNQITIATWQSLDHFPELFGGVMCVIVDEVHQAKAKILNEMLTGPAGNVPFRFGCTGTLPKEELFKLQIEACIGKSIFTLRTWELQHRGVLAETNIIQIRLADTSNPSYIKRVEKFPFEDWNEELDWLFGCKQRVAYIARIIDDVTRTSGNTLVLVPFRKHGKLLQELIPGAISLDGRDKNRQAFYDEFNAGDNQTLICTYGIASTGIDIPRIYNLTLLEPGKRFERVNQTLGRGVRKASDKDKLNVYDFCSDCGMSGSHARKRKALYRDARQPTEIIEAEYYNDDDTN